MMISRTVNRKSAIVNRKSRRGFTFIEILATMTLIAIVLPSIMNGISLCLSTAGTARQQSEASALAHDKMLELLAEGQLQTAAMSGDFGTDWPGYQWSAQIVEWNPPQGLTVTQAPTVQAGAGTTTPPAPALQQGATLQELDVTVTWTANSRQRTVTMSTLIYTSLSSSPSGSMGGAL